MRHNVGFAQRLQRGFYYKMVTAAKRKVGVIRLRLLAGAAKPAPPVSVVMGQKRVNLQQFCARFNELTARCDALDPLCVKLELHDDGGYDLVVREPSVTCVAKRAAGVSLGASRPGSQTVGVLTRAQVVKLAAQKNERYKRRINQSCCWRCAW